MTAKNKRTRSPNPHPDPGNKTNPGHNPGPFAWLERREMAWKTVSSACPAASGQRNRQPPSCTSQGPSKVAVVTSVILSEAKNPTLSTETPRFAQGSNQGPSKVAVVTPVILSEAKNPTLGTETPRFAQGSKNGLWKGPVYIQRAGPAPIQPKTRNDRICPQNRKSCASVPACHSDPAPAKRLGVCRRGRILPMAGETLRFPQRACDNR